ncbi:hypothetical protein BDW74DRAFT_182459 [Aspergillus multicolor]|uniref:uncharacterized protein n=1 Tax=Aspergillus multicolor TaxID=41759 RepID=UPI003CCDEE6A
MSSKNINIIDHVHPYIPEDGTGIKSSLHMWNLAGVHASEAEAYKIAVDLVEWFRSAGCKTLSACNGYITWNNQAEPATWNILVQLVKPEQGYSENWDEMRNFHHPITGELDDIVVGLIKKPSYLVLYKDVPFLRRKRNVQRHHDEAS